MSNLNDCIGISLSDQGVAVAHIHRAGEMPSLEVCEFRQCASEDELPAVLDAIANELGLYNKDCVLTLSPEHYEVFLVEAVSFTAESKVAALQERVGDLLEFPVADAILEYIPLPVTEASTQEMGYVVAARKHAVDTQAQLLRDADLRLMAIDIAEMVARNIAVRLPEAQQGMFFLHLTPNNSQLLFIRGGQVCMMRNIELELDAFSDGEMGEGLHSEAAAEIFIESLANELERSMAYCEASLGLQAINHLVITPYVGIEDIIPGIESRANLSARIMDLSEVAGSMTEYRKAHQQKCLLSVGAALREEVLA